MPFSDLARNEAIDGVLVDRVQIHDQAPGSSGTTGAVSSKVAATFGSPTAGRRNLSTDVNFTGLDPSQSCTHFSIWGNSGADFKGGFAISGGDTVANAAGEFTLKATDTFIRVVNPA